MSIHNWIMKVLFNTYEEWHMKNPTCNSKGFHIVGIDNSLKVCMMAISCTQRYIRPMR